MSGMVKRSAGKQMGLFRTLAREEQKKLQALKAGDGDAKAIAESEKRLRQLTEKMAKLGNTPDATAEEEAEASQQARRESHVRRQAEVHLSDNMTEEELKAWRQRREDENVAAGAPKNSRKLEETMGACSVCYVPTSKKTLTGVTTSYFCSPKCQPVCQRDGWKGHLERVRKDELAERKRRELEEDMRREDLGWDKQTMDKLAGEDDRTPDVDFLGTARGKCYDTGCSGYVQQRGAPRNIKPRTGADGNVECGVWSWNRVDHLACGRCVAPSGAHEDLTEELKKRNRRATAGGGAATKRNDGGRDAGLSGKARHRGGLASGYYYAHKTGTSKDAPAYAPNKLAGASESDTDEDEAVTYVGGSKQVASTPGKGTSDYDYAHKPENHVTKVDMPPQKLA
ncbi:hypothetical protein JL721_4036 [Aureococcus anophagefferens]|nr:hypothetical protein JL721_4036 [Aureococcus anophagefferens]